MATTFTNRREVQAYVQHVLHDHGVLVDTVDVDAVVDTLHQIAGGTWDVQHINPNIFWATITQNRDTPDTP